MSDLPPNEDQAVRYLLGELEGPEKSDFEIQLAASPALRAQLLELEAACSALALSAPARRPAPRVWKRIAEQTRAPQPKASAPPTRLTWLPAWREWFWGAGWAAAAFVAILWATRDSGLRLRPTSTNARFDLAAPQNQGPDSSGLSLASRTARPEAPRPSQRSTALKPAEDSSPDSRLTTEDWVLLRQRLHELGALNQTLSQQLTLPPGAARFQVFRLTPTNNQPLTATQGTDNLVAVSDSSAHAEPTVPTDSATLQSLLAQALARELAVATPHASLPVDTGASPSPTAPPTSTSTTASTPPPTSPSETLASTDATPTGTPPTSADTTQNPATSDSSSFAVIDLPSSQHPTESGFAPPTSLVSRNATQTPGAAADPANPAAPATALGVYSSETGLGSIALVTSEGPPPGYAYQFWVVNNQASSTFSLGTTTHAGGRLVVNFSLDPNLVFSPGFLVTLEPEGGSAFPTGPVVVAPPAATTPNP